MNWNLRNFQTRSPAYSKSLGTGLIHHGGVLQVLPLSYRFSEISFQHLDFSAHAVLNDVCGLSTIT